jgi:hypothetical protein
MPYFKLHTHTCTALDRKDLCPVLRAVGAEKNAEAFRSTVVDMLMNLVADDDALWDKNAAKSERYS